MKKAFTLAEVLIVLTIIGILIAILAPIALQNAPDENVLKFKKGNSTLLSAINLLIESDQYYLNGDLGKKPDGTLVKDKTYFCKTLADTLSTESVNCSTFDVTIAQHGDIPVDPLKAQTWFKTLEEGALYFDNRCDEYAKRIGEEIKTTDGIVYYQVAPNITFGMSFKESTDYSSPGVGSCQTSSTMYSECPKRLFADPNNPDVIYPDANGLDVYYKIFCMDIDGIPANSVALYDCKNECPFGYGIRADGKILYGKRAQEWINKTIQK